MDDKKVIVIVEDDELTISLYKKLLSKKYKLELFISGEEFLNSFNNQIQFDLTIIDLSLKGKLSGIDVIEFLKSNESVKHIPVICVTAHAFPKDRDLVLNAGTDDFLVKPVANKIFLDKIAAYLSQQDTNL